MDPVDHDRHQVQPGQVRGQQIGQGGLGHRHELPRHRRLAGRLPIGLNLLADWFQRDRVPAGRHPGQHPLHRHPTQQLGGGEQLIGRHRHLPGPVSGTNPGTGDRNPPTTESDRTLPGAVPGRGPARVVPTAWPADGSHIGLHQLLHHLQSGPDREREESLTHVGGNLGHRNAHLLRHGQRVRIRRGRLILLGHSGPLSLGSSWRNTRDLPLGRHQAGDRHLKLPRDPGQPRRTD